MNDTNWVLANCSAAIRFDSAQLFKLVERARRSTRNASILLFGACSGSGAYLGPNLVDPQLFWGDSGIPAAIGALAGGCIGSAIARSDRRTRLKGLLDAA